MNNDRTTYYEVKGTYTNEEGEKIHEVLYGSYVRSECKYEKDANKDQWREEGYKAIRIERRETKEQPDPEVYSPEDLLKKDLEENGTHAFECCGNVAYVEYDEDYEVYEAWLGNHYEEGDIVTADTATEAKAKLEQRAAKILGLPVVDASKPTPLEVSTNPFGDSDDWVKRMFKRSVKPDPKLMLRDTDGNIPECSVPISEAQYRNGMHGKANVKVFHTDHDYTATVHNPLSLAKYLLDCNAQGKGFRTCKPLFLGDCGVAFIKAVESVLRNAKQLPAHFSNLTD